MKIVLGVALALLVSPAIGETLDGGSGRVPNNGNMYITLKPLKSGDASAHLVERGAYLVNGPMFCHNCHTPAGPQGFNMSRALSGGPQTFDEPDYKVVGSNITPDKETGIGNWSDAELKKFLVSGVKPNGTKAAPIMPYEFYTVLTARDLDAVVAYLKTVAPVRHEVPAPEYRRASKPETPTYGGAQMTDAQMSDKLTRGRYLLSISHCLECHTPEGPSSAHDFAGATGKGGRKFPGPWGESVSGNITSDPTSGLGQWSDDEIKRAITQGVSRDGRHLKPPMAYPAYATMTAQDLDALVAFVRTIPPLQ